jgi:large subunit ribosomal protein L17
MRHKDSKRKLNMTTAHRVAVMKNLAISLISAGKIETTIAKAKELRSYVEPIITRAKDKNVHNVRILLSKLGNKEVLSKLFEIASSFQGRPGGYTRITKSGNRLGDYAKTAIIELL